MSQSVSPCACPLTLCVGPVCIRTYDRGRPNYLLAVGFGVVAGIWLARRL